MIDKTPTITEPVRQLMAMDCEVVSAKYIAPVVKMSESVIIHRVKSGEWDPEMLGKYVISGNRVKFFRKDFLQKCGFIEPDMPERTVVQAIDDLREELHELRLIMLASLSIGPLIRLDELKQKETASAATPAE